MYDVTISGLTLTGASQSAIFKECPQCEGFDIESRRDYGKRSAISWSTGGQLTISGTTIDNNQGGDEPILNLTQLGAPAVLSDDTICDNSSSGAAGAISVEYGSLTGQDLTIANNSAASASAGIGAGINLSSAPGSANLINSIVARNSQGPPPMVTRSQRTSESRRLTARRLSP